MVVAAERGWEGGNWYEKSDDRRTFASSTPAKPVRLDDSGMYVSGVYELGSIFPISTGNLPKCLKSGNL